MKDRALEIGLVLMCCAPFMITLVIGLWCAVLNARKRSAPLDAYGNHIGVPRNPGERDPEYRARILDALTRRP